MTPHEPPRFAVDLLERFLPDNEPLTGDLVEAARGRSRAWFWRQAIAAVLLRVVADVRDHKRVTAEAVLVGGALLALLGFHAVVAGSLIMRMLLLQGATAGAERSGSWWGLAAAASFVAAVFVGRTIGRFHREHRLTAVLAFSGSATTAAFLNLYWFVPRTALQSAFIPPEAGLHIAASMLCIGGLFAGMASRPVLRGSRTIGAAALLAAVSAVQPAAAQPRDTATFEVASIRRNQSSDVAGSGLSAPQPGGRYIGLGVTLRRLVSDAYEGLEVLGGPDWADSLRFDVNARAGGERTPADIQRMLRALLAERFELTVHTEPRDMAVYALLAAGADRRLGPGLRPSDAACAAEALRYFPSAAQGFPPPCGDYRMGASALVARGMTIEGLARRLGGRLGRPVLDRTGVAGVFDVELEWSSDGGLAPFPRDSAGASELRADGVTLFTAVREQLGLRLEATRAAVDVLVIDRAARPMPD